MIKTDFKYSSIKLEDLKKYENDVLRIVQNFENKNCKGNDFIGWFSYVSDLGLDFINNIKKDAEEIKEKFDVLVVCGIGGSYLGSRAVIESLKGFKNTDIEILYLGNTFDERYIRDVINYLNDKNFCVNVISKSGTTLETAIAFRILKDILVKKYGEGYVDRIYATTDEFDGCLRKMSSLENYKSYVIPKNVGGRYSVFTPVGLLPIAVAGIDIEKFVLGAKKALEDVCVKDINVNIAYQYSIYRYMQYLKNNRVELFATYSPYLCMLAEWWKQLFGESEGKENKGLFPSSVNFSTDLHSLGQFVQQGSKILFITQLKVLNSGDLKAPKNENDVDNLNYLCDISLDKINLIAQEGTNKAHYDIGGVDNFTFVIDEVNDKIIGYFMFTMMYSCMLSANLLGVNPFDQPGVEFYKKEMKNLLKK